MNYRRIPKFALAVLMLSILAPSSHGQWLTESFKLKAGWNSVYLNVDASYTTLDQLVGTDSANPIQEIWLWNPSPSTAQFVTSPQNPSTAGSQWSSWIRTGDPGASLQRLVGNAAYLVHVAEATSAYTWNLKGKVVPPRYDWTTSGLNFVGFPTPPNAPPGFEAFLAPAPALQTAQIFRYPGGPLGASNPQQIFALRTTLVNRGEAFWIRASDTFNRYFGPFEVALSGSAGIRFGTTLGQASFRLRNNTDQPITVTLARASSESAPSGETAIQGEVPVLVRGDINTSTLTYDFTTLSAGPRQWTLAKRGDVGSDIEVVLGVDRQQLTGSSGPFYASILRFSDSLNDTQVDVPISAEVGSSAGLWVGSATISSVSHYLNVYAKATNVTDLANLLTQLGLGEGVQGFHYEIDPATSRVLVFGGPANKAGSYLLAGPPKLDPGSVARPYPIRLIIHNDGSSARLLQRVYYGIGLATNPVVAITENLLLPSQLASARRISATHLPFSAANVPWNFVGTMRTGSTLSTALQVAYDDQASNPFLHTYHPDHDNLNATFDAAQPQGFESYGLRREITLSFTAPASDFDNLTRGEAALNGSYVEVVTFLGKAPPNRQFNVRGSFVLNRISDIATLTQ